MTIFDVFMVILGLVLVLVSFFFTEKATSKGEKGQVMNATQRLDEDAILAIQDTVEDNLTKISEALIVKTENTLNKVTNEKIIAISDYSEQLIEKIEQNHTEVVFLYNMLNEKENVMKENYSKRNDYSKKENQLANTQTNDSTHNNQTNSKDVAAIDSKVKQPARDIQGINDDEAAMLVNNTGYTYHEQAFTEEDKQNNNQEIMRLYAEGKTITEIAKTLDLGKGEVSFVINLYKQN
ncbi:DUF6115 domain-containing protein [Anaerosporobacter sp.]|uniref:DUF6115 domain-containing protein n=1 Tax=Anaerosporobacter sp. TaxID=1872529 RepID=UPI00286F5B7B|nr:DUF6115 domain-containing protein [Anaerosporobacter sp.]